MGVLGKMRSLRYKVKAKGKEALKRKIEKKADKLGITPKEYVKQVTNGNKSNSGSASVGKMSKKKMIMYGAIGLVVIVGGYFAWKKFR